MKTLDLLLPIAGRLMRCPAAPYHENATAAEVLAICVEHQLESRLDTFGNILVHLNRAPDVRPLVLAAHLDHPGFVILKRIAPDRFAAEFLGGVGDRYFVPGVPLLLYPGGSKASLGHRISKTKRHFEIVSPGAVDDPAFAVWDLPAFRHTRGRITGRVCDDLIGCASILATLIQLKRSKAAVNVIGVFSRAEEVGFHGALALADSKRLPRESLIISLETSRELPPVKMGQGVIVRVGDRSSIFDSGATRFLVEIATDLQKKHPEFRFQRALMAGGTCEATAYQEFGYICAGVCVALGNYHNCGGKDRIRAEYISSSDATGMTDLLAAAARNMTHFEAAVARLPARLESDARSAGLDLLKKPLKCSVERSDKC